MTPIVIKRQGANPCAAGTAPEPAGKPKRPHRRGGANHLGVVPLVVAAAIVMLLAMRMMNSNDDGFDWAYISDHDYGGHTIGSCGGDGPFVCVAKDGQSVGVVEHFTAPVASYEFLDDSQSPDDQIRLIAGNFVDAFRVDRGMSCPTLDFLAMDPQTVSVAGSIGLAWGFALLENGRVVEQTLDYGVVRDGTVHILVVNASEAGACVPTDHGGFTVAGLHEFEPAYKWLASASILAAAP